MEFVYETYRETNFDKRSLGTGRILLLLMISQFTTSIEFAMPYIFSFLTYPNTF